MTEVVRAAAYPGQTASRPRELVRINMSTATDVMARSFPKMSRIQQFRSIVETETAGQVDGYDVDLYSAGLVCSVHDAVKPKNQTALMELAIPDVLCVCLQMVL
jgi:hypothetical protein